MNLIEESFNEKKDSKKSKASKIILALIIMLVIAIIAIVAYLMYIQSTTLRLTVNGQSNEALKQLLVFEEDGTIYAPIKEVASYFGYDSYNGDYYEKSEIQSKCYVKSNEEVANFALNSSNIYKLEVNKEENYEYINLKKPVKAINGTLYTTTEGLEKGFNVSFNYDKNKNRIDIYTLPYLLESYSKSILDLGFSEISSEFVNQKALLNDILIVEKESNSKMGAIDLQGNIILDSKYDKITYLGNTEEFKVESNGKAGIISKRKETKVQLVYDNIELIDANAGLYLVKKDNKYGVIDSNENIKIYIENDQIGIDMTKFTENSIKNKYILVDTFIPVRKDKYWALYDKKGNQITDFIYDSFGYIATNNKEAINLLEIPNYKVLVACKDKKYTLINTAGKQLFNVIADDIFMTISGGKKHYYIFVNDTRYDAEELLDRSGVSTNNSKKSTNDNKVDVSNEIEDDSKKADNNETNKNEIVDVPNE